MDRYQCRPQWHVSLTLGSGDLWRMQQVHRTKGHGDRIHSVFQSPDHQGVNEFESGGVPQLIFGKPIVIATLVP